MTVFSTPFDLVANTAPVAPDNVAGGQSIAASFTIRNQGAFETGSASWKDGLYLSADQTWDANDTLLGSINHSGFAAGEQRDVELNVRIPECLSGTYFLIAKPTILIKLTNSTLNTTPKPTTKTANRFR